jgi:hypothetical protein
MLLGQASKRGWVSNPIRVGLNDAREEFVKLRFKQCLVMDTTIFYFDAL